MKLLIQVLISCVMVTYVTAQDTYHTSLQNSLQSNYGLPQGTWLLNDSEAANLNSDFSYGNITASNQAAVMQLFSQKVRIVVNGAGSNAWDAGYGIPSIQQLGGGSVCLLVIWLRSESGDGKASLFVENSSTYEKEVFLNLDLSNQWTQYLVPFDANQTYAPGGLTVGLHLAWKPQTVEVGGLAVLNYGTAISINDLPNQTNNDQYGGWEPDAPWRDEAANRIEQFRKANLTVRVENADGTSVPNAAVDIEMLQHEFAFGSAVVSSRFAGNNNHSDIYESKLLDLDGEGHGFNWVVFENSLKWPGWEDNWIASKAEKVKAIAWLRDHDIKIRGHCLIWPGWSNLPNNMQANQNNPTYLKDRVMGHLEAITTYPGVAGNIAEWDVLNEITSNRDLEMALQGTLGYTTGREIYPEIFNKLQEVSPGMTTYLNDYVTISQANTGGGLYDLKKQFAQEIIDAGVQLDGIGFQGHIGAFPTSIYAVQSILDDFYNTFGTVAKITEYDTNENMGDELAATYLRDFLTMVFSHESANGFLMWGFWDGAHWHANAPMFEEDWTLKPAGHAFIDLVFHEWWTTGSGQTNANGEYQLRGFKGKYKVTIDCGNGDVLVDTVEMKNDLLLVKKDGELSTDVAELAAPKFRIFPNPTSDFLQIEKTDDAVANIQIFDALGRQVFCTKMNGHRISLPLELGAGVFMVVLETNGLKSTKRIVIQ
ncbi:MAG: endo-1,4-beta-xylanase [Saprospiraceae bacterium]